MKRRSIAALLALSLMLVQLPACGLWSGDSNGTSARPAPHFKPGFNLFTPEQDVELGRRSAEEVAQQVPLLRDEAVVGYVRQLGARLASRATGHKFPYQFNIIAARDINAFALPGGFIFINAGAIAAARNEGELAGVIAHEINHVALRHGTNQASKAYIAKAGLDILRTIAGGGRNPDIDQVIRTIGGAGANLVFLRFGRTAERQADLEGARLMAEAGYDPRDMAAFFETIQAQDGQRAPEFLSDHPDPGNRIASINEEMKRLRLDPHPLRDTKEFQQARARLTGNQAALQSPQELARKGPESPGKAEPATRPEPPSVSFKQFQSKDGAFGIEYPENWDALVADDSNMIFAPKGAYGQTEEGMLCTHGVFIGVVAPEASDLEAATQSFVNQQLKLNPDFRLVRRPQGIQLGNLPAFATVVAGPSPVTGVMELDIIYTAATRDGRLFYLITMAPEDEVERYNATFDRMVASIRLAR
ncbi:MAG TPA: M48 family metallopeptidase [Pyrinomonadaceae bacterium]|nr:M48 family metallopeptidase [Pyrinomonadaceae bacterium]